MTIRPTIEVSDTPAQIEAPKKRMPLVWIPATLCVGLLIAAVYLGGRILTAHSHATSPVQPPQPIQMKAATHAAPPVVPPAQPKSEAKAKSQKLATDEQVPMITPQAGQRYIQVGALNLEAARRYIPRLRHAKLEPHVAPGPKPELLRILIGPFADQDSLTRTKSELEHAGITTFVRKY